MRALLMTVLLIVAAVAIYANVTEGDDGTKAQLGRTGSHMSDSIGRMSP
jgi:hypothetical protein